MGSKQHKNSVETFVVVMCFAPKRIAFSIKTQRI